MKTIIYLVTDKKIEIPFLDSMEGYQLIQSGPNSNPDFGYTRANTGDNIADLNWYYAELIAHYWAWKHIACDIIGMEHYRRLLLYEGHPITIKEVEDLLSTYDLIVRNKAAWGYTFSSWWTLCHHFQEDLDALETVVKEIHPEYYTSYDFIVNHNTGHHPMNMMICRKTLFNEYCEWLFPILQTLKDRIDFSKLQNSLAKVPKIAAYLGEILLDVWIHYHNYSHIDLTTQTFNRSDFDQ